MKKITFLGPFGATFSHDAYNTLAGIYGAPKVQNVGLEANYVPAAVNGGVLKLIAEHGGYGALAMETLAEGRVAEPLESFIELLESYDVTYENSRSCPFHIIGAVRLKLHFCLMARAGVSIDSMTKIIAHPKALGACKARVEATGLPSINASSNGEAARLVAEDDAYQSCAALGPRSASNKYDLQVLHEAYEDQEAITTFFLIGPKKHYNYVGKENRALIVFKAPHQPGALVKALQPFEQEHLNLIQIHSMHTGNDSYHFVIEIEVRRSKLVAFERAAGIFQSQAEKFLIFRPFKIISR